MNFTGNMGVLDISKLSGVDTVTIDIALAEFIAFMNDLDRLLTPESKPLFLWFLTAILAFLGKPYIVVLIKGHFALKRI